MGAEDSFFFFPGTPWRVQSRRSVSGGYLLPNIDKWFLSLFLSFFFFLLVNNRAVGHWPRVDHRCCPWTLFLTPYLVASWLVATGRNCWLIYMPGMYFYRRGINFCYVASLMFLSTQYYVFVRGSLHLRVENAVQFTVYSVSFVRWSSTPERLYRDLVGHIVTSWGSYSC